MSSLKAQPTVRGSARQDPVAAMKHATIVGSGSKAVLPAEIIVMILDYLPVPELFRFARTSRRLQEMVYDDTRWVARLKAMGCWNEMEARARFEDNMKRRLEAQRKKDAGETKKVGGGVAGPGPGPGPGGGTHTTGRPRTTSSTLFDAGWESEKQNPYTHPTSLEGGFNSMTLAAGTSKTTPAPSRTQRRSHHDPEFALKALSSVRSIRGGARQEFGRVYGALAPFYFDLVRARSHTDPALFRSFREPEQQALMLAQLARFARGADWAQGRYAREERMHAMSSLFETAALREFERGYEDGDVDGRMTRYAQVLITLNGGGAAVEAFVQNHPLVLRREDHLWGARAVRMSPLDCLRGKEFMIDPAHRFFRELAEAMTTQGDVIDRVFLPPVDAMTPFLERVAEDLISEYVTGLLDEAHERAIEPYLKAFAGVYEQAVRFSRSLKPTAACSGDDFHDRVSEIVVTHVFEQHVDLYLQEELDFFRRKCESEVTGWEKRLQAEDMSAESFYMSNVHRQAAKKDFLTSFKKVVMMPVAVMPFAVSKPTSATSAQSQGVAVNGHGLGPDASRSGTPDPGRRSPSPRPESMAAPPTTELAAKAALMNSRLEGIRSLFSIELALTLVHAAKTSLDRAALLARQHGGRSGDEAKEQCEAVFVQLLQTLGGRHIKAGFDRAVGHLAAYKPREHHSHPDGTAAAADDGPGKGIAVQPLVTFLELVNVGDLIQQMVDVFYAQELANAGLVDRDDFVSPANKEKKRFEQMLDERVAAGLNKGIDVLMEEVEYICATTQLPNDFNPGAGPAVDGAAAAGEKDGVMDIGPSATATKVVDIVSSHTSMLVGSTDKNMLDVFNQEVGLRLFALLCKHLKRQRISIDGAIKLISDTNAYYAYITTLRNKSLTQYFSALRELSQIYLISPNDAKEIATIIADRDRYYGIFQAEEVYQFAARRADWFLVKNRVERAMYGIGCEVM